MRQWSTDKGYEINKNVYIAKQSWDDILTLNMAYDESVGHFKTAERGWAFLNCLRRTQAELSEAQRKDKAVEESEGNRGFAEALKLSETDPRNPPDTLEKFKKAVATAAAKLWAMFGEKCALYQHMLALRETLELDSVTELEDDGHYTPLKIRQYTWVVHEEVRKFFAQKRHPNDFKGAGPYNFPKSRLNLEMNAMSNATEIIRSTFPGKWMSGANSGGEVISFNNVEDNANSQPLRIWPPHRRDNPHTSNSSSSKMEGGATSPSNI
jgi:hypothetical protein